MSIAAAGWKLPAKCTMWGLCLQMAKNEDPMEDRAVFVDEFSCIGCKMCVWCASATFRMENEHGRSRVFAQVGPLKRPYVCVSCFIAVEGTIACLCTWGPRQDAMCDFVCICKRRGDEADMANISSICLLSASFHLLASHDFTDVQCPPDQPHTCLRVNAVARH